MSKPKNYIEINSTYRNRNIWKQPSDFDVLLEGSVNNISTSSFVDPVCDSAPIKMFCGSLTLNNYNSSLSICLLYTSPSPRDGLLSRMPSSA